MLPVIIGVAVVSAGAALWARSHSETFRQRAAKAEREDARERQRQRSSADRRVAAAEAQARERRRAADLEVARAERGTLLMHVQQLDQVRFNTKLGLKDRLAAAHKRAQLLHAAEALEARWPELLGGGLRVVG